jgi:hypothetical protein
VPTKDDPRVVVRFARAEHDLVQAAAKDRGLSVAAFVREAAAMAVAGPAAPSRPSAVSRVEVAVRAGGRPDAAAFQAMSARQALLRRRPSGGAD